MSEANQSPKAIGERSEPIAEGDCERASARLSSRSDDNERSEIIIKILTRSV